MKHGYWNKDIEFEEYEEQDQRPHHDIQSFTECCLNCGYNIYDVPYGYCPSLSKKAMEERLVKESINRNLFGPTLNQINLKDEEKRLADDKINVEGFKALREKEEKKVAGYHLREIKKGVYGEFSKIREESEELEEAIEQGNTIMALLEASDLIGAIEGWAEKNGSSLLDLCIMKDATHRAFNSGQRKPVKVEHEEPRKECGCGGNCQCGRKPTAFDPKDVIVDPADSTSDA